MIGINNFYFDHTLYLRRLKLIISILYHGAMQNQTISLILSFFMHILPIDFVIQNTLDLFLSCA